jgi:DNA-binding transcriptional MerR regulator
MEKALAETPSPRALPAIPAKRYFTIGEVSDLCGVKPYVLRYWEQEFTQLKPMKRRGNRRYYQHHEVLLIRRIRDLLYDQGFTISGARNQLTEAQQSREDDEASIFGAIKPPRSEAMPAEPPADGFRLDAPPSSEYVGVATLAEVRAELLAVRDLLTEPFALT